MLHRSGVAGMKAGLSCRATHISNAIWIFKHGIDLFQFSSGQFWEDQEDVDEHRRTEHNEPNLGRHEHGRTACPAILPCQSRRYHENFNTVFSR